MKTPLVDTFEDLSKLETQYLLNKGYLLYSPEKGYHWPSEASKEDGRDILDYDQRFQADLAMETLDFKRQREESAISGLHQFVDISGHKSVNQLNAVTNGVN